MKGISSQLSLLERESMGGGNRHKQYDELPPGAFVANNEVATNGASRIVINVEWGV